MKKRQILILLVIVLMFSSCKKNEKSIYGDNPQQDEIITNNDSDMFADDDSKTDIETLDDLIDSDNEFPDEDSDLIQDDNISDDYSVVDLVPDEDSELPDTDSIDNCIVPSSVSCAKSYDCTPDNFQTIDTCKDYCSTFGINAHDLLCALYQPSGDSLELSALQNNIVIPNHMLKFAYKLNLQAETNESDVEFYAKTPTNLVKLTESELLEKISNKQVYVSQYNLPKDMGGEFISFDDVTYFAKVPAKNSLDSKEILGSEIDYQIPFSSIGSTSMDDEVAVSGDWSLRPNCNASSSIAEIISSGGVENPSINNNGWGFMFVYSSTANSYDVVVRLVEDSHNSDAIDSFENNSVYFHCSGDVDPSGERVEGTCETITAKEYNDIDW